MIASVFVDVVIVHPPVVPTATITAQTAGAAAQLSTDCKRRQYAGRDKNLYRLVPFSMEA